MLSRRHFAAAIFRFCGIAIGCCTSSGDKLYLAGVDDYGYGADLGQALRGIPKDAATILLAHNPRLVTAAACRGIGLVLSGHTHGGQVNVAVPGHRIRPVAGANALQKGLGSTRRDANLCQPWHWDDCVLPVRWRCPGRRCPLLELEPHRREEGRLAGASFVQRDCAIPWKASALSIAAD